MNQYKDILKNKPDYEEYTANEVKLSVEEMRELGLLKCGGCCNSTGGYCNSTGGCSKKNKCCRVKK